jgi:hypothetical protein
MFSVSNTNNPSKPVIGFRPTPKAGELILNFTEMTGGTKTAFVNQCVESVGSSVIRRKAKQIQKNVSNLSKNP